MEISWTGRVRKEVLSTVKQEKKTLHTIKRRKTNWIGHILCRNCLLKHVTEGQIEGTVKRRSRCKQLLHDLKERRRYRQMKEEAPSMENLLWKRLWTCVKTEYMMMVYGNVDSQNKVIQLWVLHKVGSFDQVSNSQLLKDSTSKLV
jgi:hypothetical protein